MKPIPATVGSPLQPQLLLLLLLSAALLSTQPMGARAQSDQREPTEGRSDGDAKCFLRREPRFRQDPELHFYAASRHARRSLGCSQHDVIVQLNVSQLIKQNNEQLRSASGRGESAPDDDQLEEELMRNFDQVAINERLVERQLIDSGLYEPELETYIITHGYLGSWTESWMCLMKDAILNRSDANVFIVDWSGGARPLLPIDYPAAVANTGYVGRMLADFIAVLVRISGQRDAARFHLIGHSLGAQISGFTGDKLQKRHRMIVSRVTGLDPAGPCFRSWTPARPSTLLNSNKTQSLQNQASGSGRLVLNRRRLSPESGRFVMALHTDVNKFGLNENCAHLDVFVNGGSDQPGCGQVSSLSGALSNPGAAIGLGPSCSHAYAHQVLQIIRPNARKLDQCQLVGWKCSSWDAFQAAECGFCAEEQGEQCAAFFGLRAGNSTRAAGDDARPAAAHAALDDAAKLTMSASSAGAPQATGQETHAADPERRFFAKTGSMAEKHQACMFVYQVVVAARRQPAQSQAGSLDAGLLRRASNLTFYLDLPVAERSNPGGQDTVGSIRSSRATNQRPRDNPSRSSSSSSTSSSSSSSFSSSSSSSSAAQQERRRRVDVAHKLDARSEARAQIARNFMDEQRARIERALGQPSAPSELDFYTALLAFERPAECEADAPDAGKLDASALCGPLSEPRDVKLWSDEKGAERLVEWVALNYMSHSNARTRRQNSYLLAVNGARPSGSEEAGRDKPFADDSGASRRPDSAYTRPRRWLVLEPAAPA